MIEPEWIDDPNERLIALMKRDAHHEAEVLAEMRRIEYRDMVWRPYLQAGAPYGDDEDGARRWADERQVLAYRNEPQISSLPPLRVATPLVVIRGDLQPFLDQLAVWALRVEKIFAEALAPLVEFAKDFRWALSHPRLDSLASLRAPHAAPIWLPLAISTEWRPSQVARSPPH